MPALGDTRKQWTLIFRIMADGDNVIIESAFLEKFKYALMRTTNRKGFRRYMNK
jgi:hypothetical protein